MKYYKFYSEVPEMRKKPFISKEEMIRQINLYLKEKGKRRLTKSEIKRLKKVV